MKTHKVTHKLIALAAALFALFALVTPAAALANHPAQPPPGVENHRHDPSCNHAATPPMPQPQRHQRGHYELQPVTTWVDGYYDRVFVPERCVEKERKHRGNHWGRPRRMVCEPAHYTQQWVPGRYVTDQQWVWIAHTGWGYGARYGS